MPHTPDESLDSLARELRADLRVAAARVNEQFRARLIAFAARALDPHAGCAVAPEDVAQSALASFFRLQAADQAPVRSRDELWYLLATIARRKCMKVARREFAQKRGGDQRVAAPEGWEPTDPAPTPESLVIVADLYSELLALLDDSHRTVCELRLDGCEVGEIAAHLGVSERTVERRLVRVRDRLNNLDRVG